MSYKTKCNHVCIENVQSRYSNKTVTVIEHYSNGRVTQKTAQLQSIHPKEESSHLVDSSARVNHRVYGSAIACDSSAMFKTISRQFSKNLVTM